LKKSNFVIPIFNELLLHNEAEDVELGFYLSENGIIPRYNGFSSARTINIPENYTSTFISLSDIDEKIHHCSIIKKYLRKIIIRAWLLTPVNIRHKIKEMKLYEKAKNIIYFR